MHLGKKIKEFISKQELQHEIYVPSFYRIQKEEEELKLLTLLKSNPQIQVVDTIESQLADLVKSKNPSTAFSSDLLSERIIEHLNGIDISVYGVWVYYPWLEKVVHLLDENEFILVRTNRNKHKITDEEQRKLSTKKIGVIGLSVGQSVSLSLAMERGCGELRIADFDVLDLTNLNRIRTGVHNISLRKTVIVAREIAEIDPFLKVTCFHDGINETNIDEFLMSSGKIDLLIDECDSFDVKISCRHAAKALGIPVLMEGSDRCTIDIERFDLEPERPVLHGFVKDLDMSVFKSLKTMDERIPYIAPVTGVETLSPRMKASAIEIMNTITTWPQLASAVTYGGGISADLSRKILLGSLNISGRFFIDMDDLIRDQEEDENLPEVHSPDQTVDFDEYLKNNRLKREVSTDNISESIIRELIEAAVKAPSGGNNQPWLWHFDKNRLHLFLNMPVSGAYLDPDYISSYMSLGASIENLLLAAAMHELDVKWQLTPLLLPNHVAYFDFEKGYQPSTEEKALASQIPDRHTNRKTGDRSPLSDHDMQTLETVLSQKDLFDLKWITEKDQLEALGNLSGDADLLRMFIPEAHADFVEKEMRWDLEQTNSSGDGIGIHSLDLSNNNQIGLRLMKDKKAISFLKGIDGGQAFKRLSDSQFQSSSGVALLILKELSPENFLMAGITAEKFWLKANSLGYQIHPMNVPLIFFYKNAFQTQSGLPDEARLKISKMHASFKELFKITNDIAEVFLFRLFKAESSPIKTIRRPLNKTLTFGTTETAY